MTDPDLSQFEPLPKGHTFDDFTVGQEFRHHWGRTFSDGESLVFSTTTCNWHPMYVNAEFARAHGHPTMPVNPMLVLCTAVGLSVEDLSEAGGPFLGIDAVTFHEPVYPGDTLAASSTVLSARASTSRPGSGVVTWETVARNQEGRVVLRFNRTNLVRRSGSGAPSPESAGRRAGSATHP